MPRRRKSLPADADDSIHEESEPEQSSNITMPQDVLSKLITSIQQSQAEFCQQLLREVRSSTPLLASVDASTSAATANAAAAIMKSTANFSKCSSKFSGNPEESVENFIDAIEVYKSCLNISDENALLGMSMLLTSSAGTWWQGVKGSTKTWDEAITRLRSAYGERRPPFRIYVELYSLVQGTENTDLFISKVRALFAKLPQEDLCERVELDMTYGLLDRRIRKRIDRATVSTFDELLKRARAVEDSLKESQNGRQGLKPSPHIEDGSRAAAVEPAHMCIDTSSRASRSSAAVVADSRTGDSTTRKAGNTKSFCVYCKRSGHIKETCEKLVKKSSDENNSKSEHIKDIKCYGCGAANIIKSKCPKCNANDGKNSGHSAFCCIASARESRTPTDIRPKVNAPPPLQASTQPPPTRGSVMVAGTAGAPAPSSVERRVSSRKVRGNPAAVKVAGGSVTKSVSDVTKFSSHASVPNHNVSILAMDADYSDNSVPYSYGKYLHKVCLECNSFNDKFCLVKSSCVDNNVSVTSTTNNNSMNSFCVDNGYCSVGRENCVCFRTKTKTCDCNKIKVCVCTSCDQGEFAPPLQSNDIASRSVMFNGCQSYSGNSVGSKSCARDFIPISRSDDYKPFDNNTSDSQHFSEIASSRQPFSENVRGSQHFCSPNNSCQQLYGITSGEQPFNGNRNVRSFLRPVLKISILGENGTALLDSAAKSCVAGHTLYALLKAKGHPMSSSVENVKLADGVLRLMDVLTTEVNVTLEGRTRLVSFLIFPDADNNESLLGIDFLINFGICVDFNSSKWHFADSAEQFDLPFEKATHEVKSVPINSVIRGRVEKEQDRRKDYADKGRKPLDFDVGDQVLVKSHVLSNAAKGLSAKFVPKRDGPYEVVKKASPTTYLVSKINSPDEVLGRFHASQLTRFVNRDDTPPLPVMPKRNRGRPRRVKPVSADHERVPERGRLHEPEGECIAENVSERSHFPGSKRSNRGKAPDRYSPAR